MELSVFHSDIRNQIQILQWFQSALVQALKPCGSAKSSSEWSAAVVSPSSRRPRDDKLCSCTWASSLSYVTCRRNAIHMKHTNNFNESEVSFNISPCWAVKWRAEEGACSVTEEELQQLEEAERKRSAGKQTLITELSEAKQEPEDVKQQLEGRQSADTWWRVNIRDANS